MSVSQNNVDPTVQETVSLLATELAQVRRRLAQLGTEVASVHSKAADRATLLGHTVAIVTAMIAADAIQSEVYDSETQKAVYLDHPVLDAIKSVYKTLSEVAA